MVWKKRGMKATERVFGFLPEILYVLIAVCITIIYTYPLVTDLSGMFYGFPWDPLGDIWVLWWQKFSFINEIPLRAHRYFAYPTGYDLSSAHFSYLAYIRGLLLSYFTNEIFAFNILKLFSFPALAFTTYLLADYLISNKPVSYIVGLVYAFSPYHTIHNMSHFENLFWVPVTMLFLLKLLREGTYRNGILFGFFWGFTFEDNAYNAYFIGLILPVVMVFVLLDRDAKDRILSTTFLKVSALSALVFCVVLLPMFYPVLKGLVTHEYPTINLYGFSRAFSDLFIFSAKPLDFLLPSTYNPLLGWMVPDLAFGPLKGHRYTEHTLYLGYTLIILGVYAFYRAVGKAGQFGRDERDRHTVYLFFAVFIVALVLSAPPFIPLGEYQVDMKTREVFAEHKLYLPQYFLFKIFPMFRVYARSGAIVLLAVCILAAFGMRDILGRIDTRKWRFLFLSLVSLVVLVEYMELPPFRLTDVKEPAVYKWLASQPGRFPIVEYPLGAGDDPYTTYEYSFYQRIHEKYLVNGALKGSPADEFRKEVMDISREETIDKIAGIGVKYILIHEDKYVKGNETVFLDWVTAPPREKVFPVEYNGGTAPDLSLVRERLRLVKSFEGTAVYEFVEGTR